LNQPDTKDLSITINSPPPLNIAPTSLPGGNIGQPYSQQMTAGGFAPLTWSISTGTLPSGLTFANGVISGTPILPAGTSNFTVRVQDAVGQVDTPALSITISPFNVPNITTTTLQGGTANQPYSQPVAATGGIGALTWSISAGALPQGLTINPVNGVISGTSTNAETANFTVRVADTFNQSDTQALSIVINPPAPPPPNPPDITTLTLPDGAVGVLYNQTVQVTGGTAPFTWSIPVGALPAGLQLDAGVISGTPTTPGPASFTVRVQDAAALSDTQDLSITINP